MVQGLWGSKTVSFELTTNPGRYLRAGKMWVEAGDAGNNQFKKECSFTVWDNRFFNGYTSFEAADRPDQWLRQRNKELEISGVTTYQDNNNASFLLSEATPSPTTTQPPATTNPMLCYVKKI